MKNLVIGSSGFIGKPLCEYLRSCQEEVIEFDIKNNIYEDARYKTFNLHDIDRVYFLAWDVGGAKYLYNNNTQLQQLMNNVLLLENIMPQLCAAKSKFMFVSSQLSDNTDSVYGITKRLGEIWTKLTGGTIVRLWNIYGAYEKSTERSHVIGDFVHQALTNKHINMMTSGKEVRQFIYIDDLTFIMRQLMNLNTGGIHDITTNKWISIYKVAKIISKITGCTISRGKEKGSEIKIPPKHLSLQWKPAIDIYEGLEKTIRTYNEYIRA